VSIRSLGFFNMSPRAVIGIWLTPTPHKAHRLQQATRGTRASNPAKTGDVNLPTNGAFMATDSESTYRSVERGRRDLRLVSRRPRCSVTRVQVLRRIGVARRRSTAIGVDSVRAATSGLRGRLIAG
jgi:hypothetical protein